MKKWQCQVCGYIHTGDQPPTKCPVCGAPQSAFKLIENTEGGDPSSPDLALDDTAAEKSIVGSNQQWKCSVCGYLHTSTEPPQRCPVCGSPKERMEPIAQTEPEPVEFQSTDVESATVTDDTPSWAGSFSTIAERSQFVTQLHFHPIAVHIPNGVLPLTFFFTLLAVVFKSEAMAIAAKYNMFVVCLSMPVVLISGGITWFNRFNGQMTSVFQVKIACGAGVTLLSLILTLWWLIQPAIYLGGDANVGLFLFLNLLDLVMAAAAGFYGGKLVFRD